MAKSKGTRLVITLECTECRTNEMKRSAGVSRYSTKKNRKNTPERIELKKFCPHCSTGYSTLCGDCKEVCSDHVSEEYDSSKVFKRKTLQLCDHCGDPV